MFPEAKVDEEEAEKNGYIFPGFRHLFAVFSFAISFAAADSISWGEEVRKENRRKKLSSSGEKLIRLSR